MMIGGTEVDELVAMLGDWSGPDGRNLTERLTLALRHLIESELLPAGTLLPAERPLAAALAVSRPTVSAVVAELRRRGLVQSRQGSGTRVAPNRPPGPAAPPPFLELAHVTGVINLAAAMAVDASHLGELTIGAADLLTVSPPDGVDPQGLATLRDALERHSHRLGNVPPRSGVVVTSGAHQALALALAAFVPPGGRVLAEEHSYGGLADLAATDRSGLVTVRRDDRGVDPDDLDDKLGRYRPDLVVLVANLHSPSGRLSDGIRLDEVATVLDRHGVPVVTDATYDELAFRHPDHPAPPGLASRVREAPVIAIGSLSKALWSGLRIGWMNLDRSEIQRVVRLRARRFDFGCSAASQLMALRLLDRFDGLLATRRHRLAAIADDVVTWMAAEVPDWAVTTPDGGLTVWARLPVDDSVPFTDDLYRAGVAVVPGAAARPDRLPDPHVRVCFDRPSHVLDAGLSRLAEVWPRHRS